ncbi:hypothetical protein [Halobacillus sp. B23F22_1]|uniref:hypothetical protein n=1 Tax=Halobacillus sp. B23F22_1 TaxID=3459514 RepID=UPI00373ED0E7
MTNHHEYDEQLLVKHLIRQFMRDQLKDLKENKKARNNSFVFLENSTLNMLIIHLLMNWNRRAEESGTQSEIKAAGEWREELDLIIRENEEKFSEVLSLLNEKI